MPNNDLFHIDNIAHEDGAIRATLGINQNSEILKGHFPGHPVVPGACMMQIIKEVLEMALNSPFRLKKANQLKFISIIDPEDIMTIQLDIFYKLVKDAINVTAKLSNDETVCFKFQGSFIKE